MKGDEIRFHGGTVFLVTDKTRRAARQRQRLERNPFLELPPLLLAGNEGEQRWRARARKFLRACFNEAKLQLGEDGARALFAEAVPRRRRGHQGGKTGRPGLLPDLPVLLLAAYDLWAREAQSDEDKAAIPSRLAAHLYAGGKGAQYGASAEAIARHLRRLLYQRKRHAAKSLEHSRRLFEAYKVATGEDLAAMPGTLLSSVAADNK